MAVKPTTLLVVLNKWSDVDQTGKPKGVCLYDPKTTGSTREYIGMERVVIETKTPTLSPEQIEAKKKLGDAPVPVDGKDFGVGTLNPRGLLEKIAYRYTDEQVAIENTPFHRERVRSGCLFAANEATYVAVFGSKQGFEPLENLLEKARATANLTRGISNTNNNAATTPRKE